MSIYNLIDNAETIIISGHIRPDGDCAGSCLAAYTIIKDKYPNKQVDICLEPILDSMRVLANANEIKENIHPDIRYDLFMAFDCGDVERLGNKMTPVFNNAKETVNIDHHISNTRFANHNIVDLDASSTAEIVFDLFGEVNITREAAELIYIGILHDTGNLRHSNTTPKTLKIIGSLFEKKINFSKLIDDMFLARSYEQVKATGIALSKAKRIIDNKVIYSAISMKELEEIGATTKDTGVIIDSLRVVSGVEVSIFIYEVNEEEKKVSFRSNEIVDVCLICQQFGGGGHIRASGCTMRGTVEEIIAKVKPFIEEQLS